MAANADLRELLIARLDTGGPCQSAQADWAATLQCSSPSSTQRRPTRNSDQPK